MVSFIKMIGLLILVISLCLFSSLTEYENNFKSENIIYESNGFFDNKKVVDSLMNNDFFKKLINNNEFQKVENELKKINSIKDIEVYRKNNIELGFNISDREPIAYILNSNSFLDNSSILIDRVDKVIDSLPKIYGSLENQNRLKIVKIIRKFNEDRVFKNKLEKLWYEKDELFIRIKNLDFDIRFGNVNKLNNKLEMLKGFYFYIYNDSLMSKYEQIDLVYNNRLIAIKK